MTKSKLLYKGGKLHQRWEEVLLTNEVAVHVHIDDRRYTWVTTRDNNNNNNNNNFDICGCCGNTFVESGGYCYTCYRHVCKECIHTRANIRRRECPACQVGD